MEKMTIRSRVINILEKSGKSVYYETISQRVLEGRIMNKNDQPVFYIEFMKLFTNKKYRLYYGTNQAKMKRCRTNSASYLINTLSKAVKGVI